MLALTKIKRTHIIDHVMPSDLDDKDIKHGLYLKEKMISEITDDYIKNNYKNWKELERDYRKRGLTDVIDKIMCGEMSMNDIKTPQPVRCEVWMRWKNFTTGPEDNPHSYIEQDKKETDFSRWESYDFDRLDGYSKWIRPDSNNSFILRDVDDIMVQFQLVIIGENAIRYYPYQDISHYSGFNSVDDNLKIYDPQLWKRVDGTGKLVNEIEDQNEYYRLFFKNYKGYYTFDFFNEDEEWIKTNYPTESEVRTIQSDPIRVKYIGEKRPEIDDNYGSYCLIDIKQWVKCSYRTEMINVSAFRLVANNLHVT